MQVVSKYTDKQEYKIFIKKINEIVKYMYLLSNSNEYYVCLRRY